jgi:hypothetical protein
VRVSSGKPEKRYYSRRFGSHLGNPETVAYAGCRLPEESRWLPGYLEGRFTAVVAAIHKAAFAIILWSEVDVVAKTTFVFAWGVLNFFWLAVLGQPGLSTRSRRRSIAWRSDTARPSGLCPVAVGGRRCRLLE